MARVQPLTSNILALDLAANLNAQPRPLPHPPPASHNSIDKAALKKLLCSSQRCRTPADCERPVSLHEQAPCNECSQEFCLRMNVQQPMTRTH
jgi:hypothetical protein